jgi:hypothetical protein
MDARELSYRAVVRIATLPANVSQFARQIDLEEDVVVLTAYIPVYIFWWGREINRNEVFDNGEAVLADIVKEGVLVESQFSGAVSAALIWSYVGAASHLHESDRIQDFGSGGCAL